MAYIKNNWVDREGTTRYFETVDNDGALIFTPDYTQVTELGTPVNADNMNHIEEGIAAGSFTKFDLNTTYALNDLVTVIEDGSPVIYKSLVDNNIGNALSSSIAWEKISLGGGGGLEIGDIGFTQMAIDETKGKRRYLNGQVIIQDQYVEFTNKVKSSVALNPDLACTEAEWQTELTMSANGVCYKYVIDDEAGTIRLPKYPDYLDLSINGAKSVSVYGTGKTLGLTNGTKNFTLGDNGVSSNPWPIFITTGFGSNYGTAFNGSGSGTTGIVYDHKTVGVTTDASKSGLTGGVTTSSEQIKGTYFIQVATGAETEDNIINEIELNNPFSLLDYKYSEYELNNLSWLRSEGQYNSKAVYPAVYDLLLKIYNGTETKAGVSVKLTTETFTDYDFVLNTAEETFRLPLKVKQKFFNGGDVPVVGNGMALGLTDTARNFGLLTVSGQSAPWSSTNAYGANVGANISSDTPSSSKVVGVTTNSTKSGLVAKLSSTEVSGLYLYFYVGETVQNANLVNIGRIQEHYTTKSMVDGQWVNAGLKIGSGSVDSNQEISYDLSGYLPNDGYDYEVIFDVIGYTGNANGNNAKLVIYSDVISYLMFACANTRTTSTMDFAGNAILPVGAERKVYLKNAGNASCSVGNFNARGYRRIGTNL